MQEASYTTISAKRLEALIGLLRLFFSATVARRIVCAFALAFNFSPSEAAEIAGVCEKSSKKYAVILDSKDPSALLAIKPGGKASKLEGVRESLVAELDSGRYQSLRQVCSMIKEKYGISVSKSRLSEYLHSIGYKKLACSSLPAKADPEAQRDFFFGVMIPLMAMAQMGHCHLFFMDASHFVYGASSPGSIWAKERRAVRTFCGRQRHNVLGALDFAGKKVETICNDAYINAATVIEMLNTLSAKYAGLPIFIILDNARYQKCKAVTQAAAELCIFLVWLPTYSPNLNLIERVWRGMKESLSLTDFDSFGEFKDGVHLRINDADLDSAVSGKAQLFDDDGLPFSYELPKGWLAA